MKIIINKRKARDFIQDRSSRIRTPMYFEELSDDAKEVYKSILKSSCLYTYEISENVPTLSKAVIELAENGYISVLG